uniref:Uncharacterized protein n=1 Tax=Seriola lalandi dorsalis TaxID=1841481 RepID=A0A3B4YKW7_SERLL
KYGFILSWIKTGLCPLSEESEADSGRQEREKRSLPYWDLWSSDFFGWLEELRAQAAHDGMQDLARTFWAHFPIGNELGYDTSYYEEII